MIFTTVKTIPTTVGIVIRRIKIIFRHIKMILRRVKMILRGLRIIFTRLVFYAAAPFSISESAAVQRSQTVGYFSDSPVLTE